MLAEPQTIPIEKMEQLSQTAARLRGSNDKTLHASIVVPVNARGDLHTVLNLLDDLKRYHGRYNLEVVLVINNYSPESVPAAITNYRQAGLTVVAEPDVHRPGEVVIVSARALGVFASNSDITIHFDADCRIPNPTELLTWYVKVLQSGPELAYSHVTFYDLRPKLSIHIKIALHHISRFIKRVLIGIPTTRGSNYAILRQRFLDLYASRKISVDMQVGPAVKLSGAKIVYSGRKELFVYTSGRRFNGGWIKMLRYFRNRLIYNIRSLAMLRKKQADQQWKGFDQENENRQALLTQSSEEIIGQPVIKNTANGEG
jgi:hypothetical protein